MTRQPLVSTICRSSRALLVCASIWGCALGFAWPARAAETAESTIPWQKDIRKASAAALPVNKPMLIEFWADWCAPCKVMDAEVYTDPGVIKAMARVMPVKIDVDKPDDALIRKYDVVGMPLLLFADSYGNELFRFSGAVTVDTMIQLLQELPGDVTTINRLGQILATDKDNFEALDGLGRELRSARLFRASNRYYDRAVRVGTVPKQAPQRGDIFLALGHNHLELKEFREAEKMFERYLDDFSGGRAEPEAMLGLGRALLFQEKRADAKRTLQKLTGRFTNGPAYTEATRLLASL